MQLICILQKLQMENTFVSTNKLYNATTSTTAKLFEIKLNTFMSMQNLSMNCINLQGKKWQNCSLFIGQFIHFAILFFT